MACPRASLPDGVPESQPAENGVHESQPAGWRAESQLPSVDGLEAGNETLAVRE